MGVGTDGMAASIQGIGVSLGLALAKMQGHRSYWMGFIHAQGREGMHLEVLKLAATPA